MPASPLIWPPGILKPLEIVATPVATSRSGGPSIGNVDRSIRTDRGSWRIGFRGVRVFSVAEHRVWNALQAGLNGRAGQLILPVWQNNVVPGAGPVLVPHSDGSSFDDGSLYAQPGVCVFMETTAARGATSVTLRIESGIDEPVGVRFSYLHALYLTSFPTAVSGALWTVPVTPAIRQTIPAGAALEFDLPTCRVNLATDDAMEGGYSRGKADRRNVDFVEDTAYWADLIED